MRRAETSELGGTVLEALPNELFRVELEDGRKILCHLGSALKRSLVQLLPGDTVSVVLSPYDGTRGRITATAK